MVRRRRRWRRARIISLAVALLGLSAAAAYEIDRGVVVTIHLWDEHHRHVAAASTPTTAPATTTTIPGPPPCTTTQVTAGLSHWHIVGDTLYEIVVLDDPSGTPCTLTGFATLGVDAPDGTSLPAPVHDDPTLGASAGASTSPLTMGTGQQGWFELSYPVDCTTVLLAGQASSGAPGQCYRGASLGVLLAQSPAASPVSQPLGFTYGASGFDVGPFASGAPPDPPPVGP
jgi:hypothetical protein